jgi:hypothetical protein
MLTNATHSEQETHLLGQLSCPKKPSGKERQGIQGKQPQRHKKINFAPKRIWKTMNSKQKELRKLRAEAEWPY